MTAFANRLAPTTICARSRLPAFKTPLPQGKENLIFTYLIDIIYLNKNGGWGSNCRKITV